MFSGFEGVITENECLLALNEFKNGKSPGSDGFTAEFYKFFWNDISENLILSLNYAFEKGELPICQKRVKVCLTTYYGLCNSIRQNWNNISKESRAVVDLIPNWRTNNSNLTTANLLQPIADSKFVSPSSEQKILNSGVSKGNLSKI